MPGEARLENHLPSELQVQALTAACVADVRHLRTVRAGVGGSNELVLCGADQLGVAVVVVGEKQLRVHLLDLP
jgi:hypothetical protein